MNLPGYRGSCRSCPRCCGADRAGGETGFCGAADTIIVSHIGLHFGEEPPVSGTGGSGAVFYSGCNLRCVFCQNYQISRNYTQAASKDYTPGSLAQELILLEQAGAHNINFVSPSHMVYQTAETIRAARERGLSIPIVYNSNGYDSTEALRETGGLVDIFLPDLKYMDNASANRYSGATDYVEAAVPALKEMYTQAGLLELDERGIAQKGLLVRHLVLPGQLENSRNCLDFLASIDNKMYISLMSQYSPMYRAAEFPEINRKLKQQEYDQIVEYADSLGLENVFIQEMTSSDNYVPDFERDEPFDNKTG